MQGLQGLQANNSTMFSFPYCSQFNGGRSSSVTGSPVGSPSPPLTLYGHPYADTTRYGSASPPTSTSSLPLCLKTNYHNHQRMPTVTASNFRKSTTGKSSFTIEAILGLQSRHSDDDDDENTMDHNGTINSSSSNHHHHNYHGVGTTGMVHSTVPHESHVYYNTKSEGGVSGIVSSHLSQATSGRNVATGNYFNGHGVHGSQNQQQNQSRFHQQHHHQHHSQGGGNSSHHHLSHHHYVPVVDPYICTSQQLSPPCLSPDSTRKDKPSPLRRSYQSQHSPNSNADSDQSSSTTGSQHRLTPKMTPNGSIGGQHSPISSAKSKRVRTIFTPEQLERLEREFERQQYMVGPERLYLASALQLSEAQVKVWFQNRRIKWRKQHLEMQQARLAKFRGSDSEESQITTEEVIPDV